MNSSYIAMNYKCNHKCICCPITTYDRLHKKVEIENIKKQILKMYQEFGNNVSITISGGEPTLDDNFIELISFIAKLGFPMTILSNASTCQNSEFVKQILNALEGYDMNKFSYVTAIHSINDKIHDRITRVPGSLMETLKGLDNLSETGINISVKNIMNRLNCPSMEETSLFLDNHFGNNMSFIYCATDYTGQSLKHLDELYISFGELQTYLESTLDALEKNNTQKRIYISETPLCLTDPYYWKYFVTGSNNISTYIAPSIENDNNTINNITSYCNAGRPECSNCDVQCYCDGVWDSTYKITDDKELILRPVKAMR